MKINVLASLLVLLTISTPLVVFAEDCAIQCQNGQESKGFANGNTADCLCIRPSTGMIPTDELAGPVGCDEDDNGQVDC